MLSRVARAAPDTSQTTSICCNLSMPYFLRDQPVAIERVIVHLGFDIQMARLAHFETQTHMSEVAGISQSTWSMIENGLAEGVRLEKLAHVAAALRLEIVLRPCGHPPGAGQQPSNGRVRRLRGATRIPGTRQLEPGPAWDDR